MGCLAWAARPHEALHGLLRPFKHPPKQESRKIGKPVELLGRGGPHGHHSNLVLWVVSGHNCFITLGCPALASIVDAWVPGLGFDCRRLGARLGLPGLGFDCRYLGARLEPPGAFCFFRVLGLSLGIDIYEAQERRFCPWAALILITL